jgi:hypothetical protein
MPSDLPRIGGNYLGKPQKIGGTININPALNISPTAATETVGHEFRHLGQNISDTDFGPKYYNYRKSVGYENVPYEQAARLGSTRDVIKKVLGDRWNDIPAKLRTNFTKAIHSNPALSDIMEGRLLEVLKTTPNPNLLERADKFSEKAIEEFYEAYKRNNLLKSGRKSIVDVTPKEMAASKPTSGRELGKSGWRAVESTPIKKDIPGTTPATNAGPYKPLDFFLEPQYRGYLQNPFFARR